MSSAFVGRRAELERLEVIWADACAANPHLVLLEGAGGAGKTALARYFMAALVTSRQVQVTGDEAESVLPFALHDQILSQLRAHVLGSGLLSDAPAHGARPTERDAFVEGALLLQYLESACRENAVIILIDDAHLGDGASLTALTFALRRFRRGRLLVLLAARPEVLSTHPLTARPEALPTLPRGLYRLVDTVGERIELGGLSRSEVRSLAQATGFGSLSERAAERLREHADGLPLHLSALLRDLTPTQAEQLDKPLPAPRSLSLLVLGALGEASREAQSLAQAAAVLGPRPYLHLAAQLAATEDTLLAVDDLQRLGIADLVEDDCDRRLLWAHPLVRAAIYDDVRASRRAELHRRAAELTQGEESLHHRVRATGTNPAPELVADLVALSQRLRALPAYRSAAEALLDAHRVSLPGPERQDLLLAAVDLLLLDGDLARANRYADALTALPDTARRLQLQARMLWLAGGHDEADAVARTAWSVGESLDPRGRDEVAAMLAQMCIMRGDGSGAVEWAERALRSSLLSPELAETTMAAAAIASALVGRLGDGLAMLPEGSSAAARYQPLMGARGMLRLWSDEPSGAKEDLRAGMPVAATTTGGGPYRLVFHLYLAEAEYRCGNWDACQTLADQGAALIEDLGQVWLTTFGHAVAALVPTGRGEWGAATAHVAAALQAAAELGDHPSRSYADNAAVHLAYCRDDTTGVISAASWLVANAGSHHEPGFFGWAAEHAAALLKMGRTAEAEARLVEMETLARDRGRDSVLAAVARLRAESAAARRDATRARSLFEQAEQLGAGTVDALEGAVLQGSYGRFLRRRGERRSALDRLQDAHRRFAALGATPFLQRVERELAACGSPAPAPLPGHPGLTPQEWSVAQLVCAGLTNQQVADQLVLSVKTVAYHLSHVYLKVGVRSRTELTVRLSGQQLSS